MARFRGTVEGGSKAGAVAASRLGERYIMTDANGWNLGVNVDGGAYGGDNDRFNVFATGGSNESRDSHRIAEVAEVDGERIITLFKFGKIVAQFVA